MHTQAILASELVVGVTHHDRRERTGVDTHVDRLNPGFPYSHQVGHAIVGHIACAQEETQVRVLPATAQLPGTYDTCLGGVSKRARRSEDHTLVIRRNVLACSENHFDDSIAVHVALHKRAEAFVEGIVVAQQIDVSIDVWIVQRRGRAAQHGPDDCHG